MSNTRPIINSDIDHLEFSIAPKWLMRLTELSPVDKIVYIRLRNCTFKMGEYWVSQDYLAHECGVSISSVKRAIEALIKFGLISKNQNGKKMFNSYICHQHECMSDQNKFKSDGSNRAVTQSDSSDRAVVIGQVELSIYKEQNKKQNIYSSFRWKEFSAPFETKSKTGECDQKLNKMSESEYCLLLAKRDEYILYIKNKRKSWSGYPMKNAVTFLTPKYWKNAEWKIEEGSPIQSNQNYQSSPTEYSI